MILRSFISAGRAFLILGLTLFWTIGLEASTARDQFRGGLVFSFANAQVVSEGSIAYFDFDVMVSGTGAGERLGTGILLINYNPEVFGTNVFAGGNAIVTRGSLITTSPFPYYGVIVNDNASSRLAVTYEYTLVAGWGGLLAPAPQQLMHIRLRIMNHGYAVGLSFAQSQMANQQYMDNNATLFSPVIATDTMNSYLPFAPADLSISLSGGLIQLGWQEQAYCSYNVYFAGSPTGSDWQLLAGSVTGTTWSCPIS